MTVHLTAECSQDDYTRHLKSITHADTSFYHYYVGECVGKRFYGVVDSNRFRIIPRIQGRNHFTPILKGTCQGSLPVQIDLRVKDAPFFVIWIIIAVAFVIHFMISLLVHQTPSCIEIASYFLLIVVGIWFVLCNHRKKVEILKQYLILLSHIDDRAPQASANENHPHEYEDRSLFAIKFAFAISAMKIMFTVLYLITHAHILTQMFFSSVFLTSFYALIGISNSAGDAYFSLALLLVVVIIVWVILLAAFFMFSFQKDNFSCLWALRFYRLFSIIMILESVCCIALFVDTLHAGDAVTFVVIINAVLSLGVAINTVLNLSYHHADKNNLK